MVTAGSEVAVRGRGCAPGFWIPDDALVRFAGVGPVAIATYVLLGFAESMTDYLPAWRVAELLQVKVSRVWEAVEMLYEQELLNDADIAALQRAAELDPPPQEEDD